ncbi:MAG: hypothetical protein ACK6D1_00540 [Planctomycetota bacterium]
MSAAAPSCLAVALGVLGALAPASAQAAPAAAPPVGFQWVLWCGDAAGGAAAAAKAGYTAVQLGRGVDPAPVLGKGLGF